jgi:aspartyl-tRNA(Asn)/glutamyl-tRNA(Gln) amidotransferase subunit A
MEAWHQICAMTLAELRVLLEGGQLTSLEITGAYLESISAQNPSLNVYVEVYDQEALAQAGASDARRAAGQALSPLDGVPIAVKDNILVKDRRCTCASRMLLDFMAPYDATVVDKLRAAGMPLLGKLNLDEFAMGSSTETSLFGPVRNPWDVNRVAGGSSGGSGAAVAAGMAPCALGSDTGGSVLQPASHCGVVGVRPAYGTVSRYGLVAFASSLDQIGPLCKTVYDAALVMNVIAGADPKDATSRGELAVDFLAKMKRPPSLEGVTLGLPRECWEPDSGLSPEVLRGLTEALPRWQAMGFKLVEVSLPSLTRAAWAYDLLSSAQAFSNLARYDGIRYGHRGENCGSLEELYRNSRNEGFGPEVKRRLLLGGTVLGGGDDSISYGKAHAVREALGREAADALGMCDGLLMPVTPAVAPPLEEKEGGAPPLCWGDRFGVPAGLTGLPAISLPCALSAEGLPMGMGLMGPRESLPGLLSMAHAYEGAYPLGQRPYELGGEGGWKT